MGRRREAASEFRARWRLRAQELRARAAERGICAAVDIVVVCSHSDRASLADPGKGTVLYPPFAAAVSPRSPDPRARTAVAVGRLQGAELDWFIDRVWPRVREAAPDAVLRATDAASSRSTCGSVGVEHLDRAHRAEALPEDTAVVAVPRLHGRSPAREAIEAIAQGIPTALTSNAAEGIGDGRFSPPRADTPGEFAALIIDALHGSGDDSSSVEGAQWAQWRYGWDQFVRRARAVYGPAETPIHDPISAPALDEPFTSSVVIPTYNGANGLPDQLDSLAAQPEASRLEVVVADNGSRDDTVRVARIFCDLFRSLRVVDAAQLQGVSHARNIGALAARGRNVLFLDDDDEVRPGYIGALETALESHDIAGAAVLRSEIGAPAPAPPAVPETLRRAPHGDFTYALGGACGVRRELVLRLAGFDQSFVAGHDEVEFCLRARLAGASIVGVPEALLDYRQKTTRRGALRQFRNYGRTSVQLWVRHAPTADFKRIRFTGAVKQLVRNVLRIIKHPRRYGDIEQFRHLGWQAGVVEGHLKYRLLGAAPPPVLTAKAAPEAQQNQRRAAASTGPSTPQGDCREP